MESAFSNGRCQWGKNYEGHAEIRRFNEENKTNTWKKYWEKQGKQKENNKEESASVIIMEAKYCSRTAESRRKKKRNVRKGNRKTKQYTREGRISKWQLSTGFELSYPEGDSWFQRTLAPFYHTTRQTIL